MSQFLYDNHSMRGGELGRMIDTLGRTIIFRRTMRKRTARLDELGIQLPPMSDVINKKGIPNLPQAAVAEIMMRSKIRSRQMQKASRIASQWSSTCENNGSNSSRIPNLILQPDHGDFYRPLYNVNRFEVIRFDHYSMRRLIQEEYPFLLGIFDGTIDKTRQSLIWSLCALHSLGGYVFGPNNINVNKYMDKMIDTESGCDAVCIGIFQQTPKNSKTEMLAMGCTPRHPRLRRILKGISMASNMFNSSSLLTLFYGDTKREDTKSHGKWDVLTCSCPKDTTDKKCCETVELSVADDALRNDYSLKASGNVPPRIYLNVVRSEQNLKEARNGIDTTPTSVEVVVSVSAGTPSPIKAPKEPIYVKLMEAKCNAGWICNRCLKNALLGTHKACKMVCPSCYREIVCGSKSGKTDKKQVEVNVTVRQVRHLASGEQRIPKIIHQTWFDEPSVDRYPQLARLQNSWKSQGWEYRFYRDEDIRAYIAKHFPPRFLDAFDSVIPGAFKADFFRYLVLLKDGGVYADADILLDINLSSIITPSMSFFVPRDIVGDYASENFCLWNGMMAAAPGHPFMVHAAEALLNNILNRVDYHDMERELCQVAGTNGDVWKIRALTILSLSGPCLLGGAVNKALGRGNFLSKYDPGWLIPEVINATESGSDDIGDALLLIASRADMGALRFSDVDRNLMIASTGMTELSKDPILTVEEASRVQTGDASHIHYSHFEHVNDIFGAQGIYVDNLVTNEAIKLVVSQEFL
jgi:hypothetical protein